LEPHPIDASRWTSPSRTSNRFTLELEDETIEAVDEKAFAEHRENREAAIRDLLDEWLKTRE
jgi:metal-responsive CopG/Arc/MetJ family transcriptional regulator